MRLKCTTAMSRKTPAVVLGTAILTVSPLANEAAAWKIFSQSRAESQASTANPTTGERVSETKEACGVPHSCSPNLESVVVSTSADATGDDSVTGEDSTRAIAENTVDLETGEISAFVHVSGSNNALNVAVVDANYLETLTFDLGGASSVQVPFSYNFEADVFGEGIGFESAGGKKSTVRVDFRFNADKGIVGTPGGLVSEVKSFSSSGQISDSITGTLTVTDDNPVITLEVGILIVADADNQGSGGLVDPKPITVDATNTAALDLDLPSGVSFTSSSGVFLTKSQAPPEFSCVGYETPLVTDDPNTEVTERLTIGQRSKQVIPVRTPLEDIEGFRVTDIDIPLGDDGQADFPVINVTFDSNSSENSIVNEDALLSPGQANDGNTFRFDSEDQTWVFNLGTRDLDASGIYTIDMVSGDTDAYRIDQTSCSVSFERQ